MVLINKRRYIFFLFIIIARYGSVFAQDLPSNTFRNTMIDLMSFDSLGARPISGSLADYMDVQGAVRLTNGPYDFAILGQGFFMARSHCDGSVYYTRSGKFKRRGNAFYNERGDRIVLSDEDAIKLRDPDANSATLSLYYPASNQEIRVIDNKKWTSQAECKRVGCEIVFHALEENPVEPRILIKRLLARR